MELGRIEGDKRTLGDADPTRHLRDHLECAQKLAQGQDLQVVRHLIQMAILALSGSPAPPRDRNGG